MSGALRRSWDTHVLPHLVERACKSRDILEERKRTIPRANGRVLEVGVGSGLNFAFYDAAQVSLVVGIDPSPPLLERARKRALEAPVSISLVRAAAEALPFDAGSFDSVVVTYTLCSVDEPVSALREMRRVLSRTGCLYFVEHGLAPDAAVARWQRGITPIWRRVSGNCHLDRRVDENLTAAGFSVDELHAAYAGDGPRWFSFTYEGAAR